jgi:hypothetical protein
MSRSPRFGGASTPGELSGGDVRELVTEHVAVDVPLPTHAPARLESFVLRDADAEADWPSARRMFLVDAARKDVQARL